MPTYEYECPGCHNRFDLRQSFHDPAIASCPACGGEAKRRLSVPAIVFKGSGWYVTDHRSSGFGSNGHSADKDDAGKSGDTDTVAAAPASSDDP